MDKATRWYRCGRAPCLFSIDRSIWFGRLGLPFQLRKGRSLKIQLHQYQDKTKNYYRPVDLAGSTGRSTHDILYIMLQWSFLSCEFLLLLWDFVEHVHFVFGSLEFVGNEEFEEWTWLRTFLRVIWWSKKFIPNPNKTGDCRNRTGDLVHAKHTRYQLRQIPLLPCTTETHLRITVIKKAYFSSNQAFQKYKGNLHSLSTITNPINFKLSRLAIKQSIYLATT